MKKNTTQETLLLPLIGRVKAQEKWPRYFNDPHSAHLISKFDTKLLKEKDQGIFPAFIYGMRYQLNVKIARKFIYKHPEATIVNLGAGLDSLFEVLDNGKITYYSLDFPEVIALRETYLHTSERNLNKACSMLDDRWMDTVQFDPDKGILLLSAGVIFYLHKYQVKDLIQKLGARFPGGVFSFDNECPSMIKMSNRSVKKKGITNAEMHFIVKDPYEIAKWSPNIEDYQLITDLGSALPDTKHLPLSLRMALAWFKRKPSIYQVVMRFKRWSTCETVILQLFIGVNNHFIGR